MYINLTQTREKESNYVSGRAITWLKKEEDIITLESDGTAVDYDVLGTFEAIQGVYCSCPNWWNWWCISMDKDIDADTFDIVDIDDEEKEFNTAVKAFWSSNGRRGRII